MENILADDTFARLPITKDMEEVPPPSTYRPAVLECCSDLSCAVVLFPIWRRSPEGILLVATISSACLQQKSSFLFDLS